MSERRRQSTAGQLGGLARAVAMTPDRRKEHAIFAACCRWHGRLVAESRLAEHRQAERASQVQAQNLAAAIRELRNAVTYDLAAAELRSSISTVLDLLTVSG